MLVEKECSKQQGQENNRKLKEVGEEARRIDSEKLSFYSKNIIPPSSWPSQCPTPDAQPVAQSQSVTSCDAHRRSKLAAYPFLPGASVSTLPRMILW